MLIASDPQPHVIPAPVPGHEQQHGVGHAIALERAGIVINARLLVSGHL